MSIRTIRMALWGAVVVAALGLGGLLAWQSLKPRVNDLGDLIAPTDTVGGPFTLKDQNGRVVTRDDLKGKPAAMFFGYTFCPDVCPTTLTEATQWLKTLGADADRLQVVFVSVDPERDTSEKLKEYLEAFDPRIRGLTGTPEQVAEIVKAYRVYARKVASGQTYLMDHTATVYLMNAQQRFVGAINYQEPTDKALSKLRQLLARS